MDQDNFASLFHKSNSLCQEKDCVNKGVYGVLGMGEKLKYCALHKESDMIHLCSKKCEFDGCYTTSPVFNYPGCKIGKYCAMHKLHGMINVKASM